jgi:WD40 repeat protein
VKFVGRGRGRVKVWEVATGAVQAELEHGGGSVRSVCFAPGDGSRLASGGADGRIKVWEVASGKVLVEMEHGGDDVYVTTALFSPGGAELASYDEYDSAQWKVWDVATGAPVLPAPDTAAWQRDDGGGGGGIASQQAATAAFAVSVDGAAAVTVRPSGAAAADADALRFSPAETPSVPPYYPFGCHFSGFASGEPLPDKCYTHIT